MIKKLIRTAALTLFFYLMQVCVMQKLRINGVVGNLLAVDLAIITVSLGKKYAFGASCMAGILLEAMTSSVGGMYVVIYPVFTMLFAQVFADMSDEKREKRMLRQKDSKRVRGDLNPHLRIPLNAMCIAASIEFVFLVYVSLAGTELSMMMPVRALISVLYTGVLAVMLMVPVRMILRMYGGRVRRAMTELQQE